MPGGETQVVRLCANCHWLAAMKAHPGLWLCLAQTRVSPPWLQLVPLNGDGRECPHWQEKVRVELPREIKMSQQDIDNLRRQQIRTAAPGR